MIVDSNGDGVADKPIVGFNYGIVPNHGGRQRLDGAAGLRRGEIMRYDPATGKFEPYSPPAPGYGPRGVDVDSKGIFWAALGGSGAPGRVRPLQVQADLGHGHQCPEGWTLYKTPVPLMPNSGPAAPP